MPVLLVAWRSIDLHSISSGYFQVMTPVLVGATTARVEPIGARKCDPAAGNGHLRPERSRLLQTRAARA